MLGLVVVVKHDAWCPMTPGTFRRDGISAKDSADQSGQCKIVEMVENYSKLCTARAQADKSERKSAATQL